MKQLSVEIPDDLERSIRVRPEEVESQIRLMAALKMFELGKLSSGKAAQLAGLSRAEFFDACGRYRVSLFNYPADELPSELAADLDAAQKAIP